MTLVLRILRKEDDAETEVDVKRFTGVDEVIIGRKRESDVCLPEGHVSSRHCAIKRQDEDYVLVDLNSSNGTELNGHRVPPGEPIPLVAGSRIDVISFALIVDFEPDPEPEPEEPEPGADPLSETIEAGGEEDGPSSAARIAADRQAAVRMIQNLFDGIKEEKPWVIDVDGVDKGKQIRLEKMGQKIVIGRSSSCDFVLRNRSISKRHAMLHWDLTGIAIHDLGSVNGTFVNEQQVTDTHIYLRDQDIIRLGTEKLMFVNPLMPATPEDELDEELPEAERISGQITEVPEPKDGEAKVEGDQPAAAEAAPAADEKPSKEAKEAAAEEKPSSPAKDSPAAKEEKAAAPAEKPKSAAETGEGGAGESPAEGEQAEIAPTTPVKATSPVLLYVVWGLCGLFLIGGIAVIVILFVS
jgi:pSer/pThr/pTyr-binding forkhead associated (FHA) protein